MGNITTEKRPLTSVQIKWIACAFMLCDHIDVVFGLGNEMMRLIGRLAFPLFVFLLVEGFTYTRSRARYAARLFVFALISEIPFDMAFRLSPAEIRYGIFQTPLKQNVMWTLLLGFAYMWIAEQVDRILRLLREKHCHSVGAFVGEKPFAMVLPVLLTIPVLASLFYIAEWMKTDYHGYGVTAVALCFWIKKWGFPVWLMPVATAAVCMTNPLWNTEQYAALSAVFLLLYGGKKGQGMPKYFFYAFYPAHLMILAIIKCST